jgi:hypothetical protein
MDSVFAEDTDPLNDYDGSEDGTQYREQVGRFVVGNSEANADGAFVNDLSPISPDIDGSSVDSGTYLLNNDIAFTDSHLTKYRYRWAIDLLDHFTVGTPTDDHLPHISPVAYVQAQIDVIQGLLDLPTSDSRRINNTVAANRAANVAVPAAVQNDDPLRAPSRTYAVAVGGNQTTLQLSSNLPQDFRDGTSTLFAGKLIHCVSGNNVGQWRRITSYVGGTTANAALRTVTVDSPFNNSAFGNQLGLGRVDGGGNVIAPDIYVILGNAEDEIGTQGLVNINTAPAPVLAMLPFVPANQDRFGFFSSDGQTFTMNSTADGLLFRGLDGSTEISRDPADATVEPLPNGVDDNADLARAIVLWRDVDDGTGTPGGPFRTLADLYRVPAVRQAQAELLNRRYNFDGDQDATTVGSAAEQRTFDANGELLTGNDVDQDTVTDRIDPSDFTGDVTPFNNFADANLRGLNGQPTTDGVAYDFEEQFLILNRVSNLATVRSDTFTVYTLLEGWVNAGTPDARRVVQTREAFILDRSGIYLSDDPARADRNLTPLRIEVPVE